MLPALVNAAKEEPDGLGCISKNDALVGKFSMSNDERVNEANLERLILIAMVDDLLRHELALEEVARGPCLLGFSDTVHPREVRRP